MVFDMLSPKGLGMIPLPIPIEREGRKFRTAKLYGD